MHLSDEQNGLVWGAEDQFWQNSGMPALSLFVGKGGVGKTTVAAAHAVQAARHKRRSVLLLSTDPAHSLGDVFDVRLGSKVTRVKDPRHADSRHTGPRQGSNLSLWQVDAEQQFRKFLDRYRGVIVSLLENGTMFSRAEIEPLLDTTLPGMAEFSALLAIQEALPRYDEIVVDTAPIGHTLRLLEMPEYFARFLDLLTIAASRDQVLAAHFGGAAGGPNPFIGEWRAMVAQVQEALHHPESRIVMVTTPEEFALNESVRTARAMAEALNPLHISELVVNRAVNDPFPPKTGRRPAGGCAVCRQRAKATRAALEFVARHFAGLPVRMGEDAGSPVLGWQQLSRFGQHVFGGKKLTVPSGPPRVGDPCHTDPCHTSRDGIKFERVAWPALETPLTWTIGKGGVGKTTMSAALAVHERRSAPRRRVTICSTDPAPSLDDVFQAAVGDRPSPVLGDAKLLALEIDAAARFRAWAEEMKDKINDAFTTEMRGIHLDLSFERQILLALLDMVPPGLDEIMAVFRVLDLAEKRQTLVIDMAPSGHALELLRMPGRILLWTRLLLKSLAPHRRMALAREVAVQIATLSHRVRELAVMLQDGRRSRVVPVMLAEPLPDRETTRLLRSLEEVGVSVTSLFVNRVLFAEEVRDCRRCGEARQWQMATLEKLRKRYKPSRERQELGTPPIIYVVRNRAREIAGAAALESFIGELWQIV